MAWLVLNESAARHFLHLSNPGRSGIPSYP
jgi:hypothetical protein